MHVQDVYIAARDAATAATVTQYGERSVPVTPGTEEHTYWLSIFDITMSEQLSQLNTINRAN